MATPTPFKVSVDQAELDKLSQKLALATFPDELDEAGWAYGAPLADVKRLAAYWRDSFDWRRVEAAMNELPNYQTRISVDGFGPLHIHFVHQRSHVQQAIPLLFVHGWPGSFIEVTNMLSKLQGEPGSAAFHVVAPSLPNFGFSEGVRKTGFGLRCYGEVCHKLMLSLGYDEYVTQGGDWGMYITRAIGFHYPQHCKASHLNMIRGSPPKFTRNPLLALQHALTPYSERDKKGLERSEWFLKEGSGYRQEQGTKPQTLGYALADSPVGLLAWIYEKLHDWTDAYPWTDDEILTWVSIYWFSTAGPAANLRIYYEATHDLNYTRDKAAGGWVPHVKLGLCYMPRELGVYPKTWGRTMGPVVYESEHQRGGHFAAWERPEVIVHDLQEMFGKNGPCYGIVQGRKGYDGAKL